MQFNNNGDGFNLLHLLMIFLLSLWGGLVSYLGKLKSGSVKRFNFVELIIEFTISSFAGLVIGFIALSFNFSPYFAMALAGVAGHAGGRTVFFLNKIFFNKLSELSKRIFKP